MFHVNMVITSLTILRESVTVWASAPRSRLVRSCSPFFVLTRVSFPPTRSGTACLLIHFMGDLSESSGNLSDLPTCDGRNIAGWWLTSPRWSALTHQCNAATGCDHRRGGPPSDSSGLVNRRRDGSEVLPPNHPGSWTRKKEMG